MGFRRITERRRAIKLRLQGKSYNEIRKIIGVPSKGTISVWLRGITLTSVAKKRLANNIKKANERGLFKFNAMRTARIQKENIEACRLGIDEIGNLSKRELMLVGAALYWGEGTKNFSNPNVYLSFVNSDPKMIRCYMRFLREVLSISKEKIKTAIHLYSGTTDETGKEYWSKITGLPKNGFRIIRQISRASRGKRNPRLLPFGTVVIRVHDRKLFSRVRGMIEGLAKNA